MVLQRILALKMVSIGFASATPGHWLYAQMSVNLYIYTIYTNVRIYIPAQ